MSQALRPYRLQLAVGLAGSVLLVALLAWASVPPEPPAPVERIAWTPPPPTPAELAEQAAAEKEAQRQARADAARREDEARATAAAEAARVAALPPLPPRPRSNGPSAFALRSTGNTHNRRRTAATNEPKEPRSWSSDRAAAWYYVTEQARESFDLNSTADFPSARELESDPRYSAVTTSEGHHKFRGWFEGQNAFGATVRQRFEAEAVAFPGGHRFPVLRMTN